MNQTLLVLTRGSDPELEMLVRLSPSARVVIGASPADFHAAAPDATAIFNWSGSPALLREVFPMCPSLRWVASRAAGVDKMLFPELIESEVLLTNGAGVFSPALAEFALAAILYFAKDLPRMVRNQMAGVWERVEVTTVAGQTVGIVGYGDIGRAVAKRARAIGMKALAVRRHVASAGANTAPDAFCDQIYGRDGMLDMLPLCDYVVASTPLTAETRGMIGEPELAAMKSTAVLINIGRGPVISETALLKALTEGGIKGAALDVFEIEPLPAGHLFYKLDNLLLSPHTADHTQDWKEQSMNLFLAQFKRFSNGEPLMNAVNKHLGY